MVRHEVDEHLESCLMSTGNKSLKLLHPIVYVISKVRINIVIVADSVWRASLTLNNGRVLGRYAELGEICL